MISGSLLLAKDMTYKDLFTKRILRIVVALTFASFVAYIVNIRKDIRSFDLVNFLRNLISGEHVSAYWYLYAYLGFLVTLPFLRRIANYFTKLLQQ